MVITAAKTLARNVVGIRVDDGKNNDNDNDGMMMKWT